MSFYLNTLLPCEFEASALLSSPSFLGMSSKLRTSAVSSVETINLEKIYKDHDRRMLDRLFWVQRSDTISETGKFHHLEASLRMKLVSYH